MNVYFRFIHTEVYIQMQKNLNIYIKIPNEKKVSDAMN